MSKKKQGLNTPTEKLRQFRDALLNPEKRIVIGVGLPSTGKTKQAIDCGCREVNKGNYNRLIIVRPVVVPECGLLPGNIIEKMNPYIRQSDLYCEELNNQKGLMMLIREEKAEVIPVDLLQGNRFNNCYVIMDEMQNVHKKETFKTLTRIGEGSKFVILGDVSSGQIGKKVKQGETILDYCLEKFVEKDYVSLHKFYDENDILGDSITKDLIITMMEDFVV